MNKLVHRLAVCGAVVVGAALAPAAVASAEVTVPFQVNPTPYGNPNGSVDSPPGNCAVVVGEKPGIARVTGFNSGCYLISAVRWLNLSTGASGTSPMSDGLFGLPHEAVVPSGPGQVALVGVPFAPTTVPGFATFDVP
nr:hypothetical protein [Rhodococcus sp. (in: high G+C Gram-positive bacteria)]